MSDFAYFSKMFQAVPQLMEVQKHAGGTFVSSRKSTLDAVRRLYPEAPVSRYWGWFSRYSPGYRALGAARAIVTGTPGGQELLSQFEAKRCMVFHGTFMFLSQPELRRMAHFDLLCTIGPRMQRTVERCQGELGLNTVDAGYLPFDAFPQQNIESRVAHLQRLGLDPQRPTVVYMPWGKPYGSWLHVAERIARETPAAYNLILRPHPSQGLTSRRSDRDSFKRVEALCRARGNTLLDINAQPLPLLFSLADLMVTDGTSPAEESLFYDVPQLFIETPNWKRDVIHGYAQKEAMHEEDWQGYLGLFECGPTYRSWEDRPFAAAVEEALAIADSLRAQREAYFAWVFGQRDRQAGARVHQALVELIH